MHVAARPGAYPVRRPTGHLLLPSLKNLLSGYSHPTHSQMSPNSFVMHGVRVPSFLLSNPPFRPRCFQLDGYIRTAATFVYIPIGPQNVSCIAYLLLFWFLFWSRKYRQIRRMSSKTFRNRRPRFRPVHTVASSRMQLWHTYSEALHLPIRALSSIFSRMLLYRCVCGNLHLVFPSKSSVLRYSAHEKDYASAT